MRFFHLIACGAAFLVAQVGHAGALTPGEMKFQVLRNGAPLGYHTISAVADGDTLRAREELNWQVDFGPITVFRMTQTCVENWGRDGDLNSIDCTTLKDGKTVKLVAKRDDRGLVVTSPSEMILPADTLPTAWWNEAAVRDGAPLLETAKGVRSTARIERVGKERIEVNGQMVEATHYRCSEKFPVDLWYDEKGHWVKTSFAARGSQIDYVLLTDRDEAPAGLNRETGFAGRENTLEGRPPGG
jgi:hypothetical protein